MGRFIGIDLGTTNSVMAYTEKSGEVKLIPNKEVGYITPSAVTITEDNQVIVGNVSKKHQGAILSIKRRMGTDYTVEIEGRHLTPTDISAMIIRKLKEDAETFLGEEVTDAVITVPAYFTDSQRTATRDAGTLAGLNILSIINEPTAASLAYGLREDQEGNFIVYDLGGGTFDVSIVTIEEGIFEVIATGGDNLLGGDDFDELLVEFLKDRIIKANLPVPEDEEGLIMLKTRAEELKIALSDAYLLDINFTLPNTEGQLIEYKLGEVTREDYRNLIQPLIDKTFGILNEVLNSSKLSIRDIKEFILVGGSTKSPIIHEAVKELGIKPKLYQPDLCVAMGAAIQAGIILGQSNTDILLLDVTPMDMGIEIDRGMFSPIIMRNSKIPCRESQIFTNQFDNQEFIYVMVYQGLMPLVSGNTLLGSFKLGPIIPMPAGKAIIEVTFELDHNGILKVKAMDMMSSLSMEIEVASLSLSAEELEEKQKESEQFSIANPDVMRDFINTNKSEVDSSAVAYYQQETNKYNVNLERLEVIEQRLAVLEKDPTKEGKREYERLDVERSQLTAEIYLYQLTHNQ